MEKETERKEKKEKTNVLPESSEKTQMCRNIARYGQCTRDVCTYAHSLMELKPRKCFFKDECTNIGSKTHPCRYIHPSESFDEYVERTKYNEFFTKHIPSPMELPIPEKRTIISEEVSRKPELTYAKVVRCEERRETGNFEITMYGYGYRVPRELVSLPPITIRCPKEFVEGIVGLAFARGMKNIRINSI
jgi:hypothetical protein